MTTKDGKIAIGLGLGLLALGLCYIVVSRSTDPDYVDYTLSTDEVAPRRVTPPTDGSGSKSTAEKALIKRDGGTDIPDTGIVDVDTSFPGLLYNKEWTAQPLVSLVADRFPRILTDIDEIAEIVALLGDTKIHSSWRYQLLALLDRSGYDKFSKLVMDGFENAGEDDTYRMMCLEFLIRDMRASDDDDDTVIAASLHKVLDDTTSTSTSRLSVFRMLDHVDDSQVMEKAETWLTKKDVKHENRALAIAFVSTMAMGDYIDTVRELVNDEHEDVQVNAIKALGRWQDEESIETLVQLATQEGRPNVKDAARSALIMMPSLKDDPEKMREYMQ